MRCLILFCPEGKKFNFALFVFCHSFHLIIFTVDVALIRNIFIFLFVKLLAQEPPVWPSAVTATWVFVLPEGGVLLSSFWLVALFFTYIFKYYIYISPLKVFIFSCSFSEAQCCCCCPLSFCHWFFWFQGLGKTNVFLLHSREVYFCVREKIRGMQMPHRWPYDTLMPHSSVRCMIETSTHDTCCGHNLGWDFSSTLYHAIRVLISLWYP